MSLSVIIITIIIHVSAFSVLAGTGTASDIFFRDDFDDLENWKPLHFRNIKNYTRYSVEKKGNDSYLKAESNASASGMVLKKEFNVFEFPRVRWRWKVSTVYEKGNSKSKSGDDYPLRVYIIFQYDPQNASFGQKLKYGLARRLYGTYPPHSTINYIWANKKHEERILTNTYADESKMILLQEGPEKSGQWVEQEIHIIEDYREAFGEDPPSTGSLAIMNDSDNTGEGALSFLDYIEVYR